LVGDIGGTKTVLALFSPVLGTHTPLDEAVFPSQRYPSLEACIEVFLQGRDVAISRAAFGVAGPVTGDQAKITNLPWLIDARQVSRVLRGAPVYLLNDLAAIATAVPHLGPDDVHTLNPGVPVNGGSIGVIAPGTGLGEAYLTWDGAHYRAHASEGGHTDFAPLDAQQVALLHYLQARLGHVSYEQVCSGGLGIPNLYAYLKDSGFAPEPDWLADALAGADDPTPVIVSAAQDASRSCALCEETLRLFVAILAAEAGNLALKLYATGGIYLGGGIPPRIIPALETATFLEAFRAKGRFSTLLAKFPIHVIKNPKVALLGGAYYAWEV
ncbi:MAG: glucokinase, partial [Anaerolineae bacterium]|nr:glucokinase [Anaerolineae bacterium]